MKRAVVGGLGKLAESDRANGSFSLHLVNFGGPLAGAPIGGVTSRTTEGANFPKNSIVDNQGEASEGWVGMHCTSSQLARQSYRGGVAGWENVS